MNKKIAFPLSALALLTLTAVPALPVAAQTSLPQGRYKTACLPIGKNDRHGFIAEVVIEGSVLSATAQSYAHDDCDVPTVEVDYRGAIEEARRQENHIDFVQRTGPFVYTLLLPEVTTYYNANVDSAGCALDGWETGVPRDVSGKTCAPYTFPEVGSRLKDRLWIKGDRISFGHLPLSWQNEADGGFPETSSSIDFVRVSD